MAIARKQAAPKVKDTPFKRPSSAVGESEDSKTEQSLLKYSEIRQVFVLYKTTLDSQRSLQKVGAEGYNAVRYYWNPEYWKHNPYMKLGLEKAKNKYINTFKVKLQTALSKEQPVPLLLKILDELHQHFLWIEEAEVKNKSKYGLALRTIMTLICHYLKSNEEFQSRVTELKGKLTALETQISDAKLHKYDPQADVSLMQARSQLLLQLSNLGDMESVFAAIREKLIPEDLEKPGDKFNPETVYDPDFSPPKEWYFDVPWIYQPELHKVWALRIKHHAFPSSQEEWELWNREAAVEHNRDQDSDRKMSVKKSFTSNAEQSDQENESEDDLEDGHKSEMDSESPPTTPQSNTSRRRKISEHKSHYKPETEGDLESLSDPSGNPLPQALGEPGKKPDAGDNSADQKEQTPERTLDANRGSSGPKARQLNSPIQFTTTARLGSLQRPSDTSPPVPEKDLDKKNETKEDSSKKGGNEPFTVGVLASHSVTASHSKSNKRRKNRRDPVVIAEAEETPKLRLGSFSPQ